MTKKELEQMAKDALRPYSPLQGIGTIQGFHEVFEACYRLLTMPMPMSEAPRDGTEILGIPNVVITWSPELKRWYSNGIVYTDDDFTGWLPIFTPLEEDAND